MLWSNDNVRADEHTLTHESVLDVHEEPPLGSHLVTPRALYTHHGIYIGDGWVIHYAGLAHGLCRGPVEAVSLERFANGHGVWIRHDARRFSAAEVVARARSRLGERRYRVLTNNCEHLCAWALRDERRSTQIESVAAILRRVAPFNFASKRRFV